MLDDSQVPKNTAKGSSKPIESDSAKTTAPADSRQAILSCPIEWQRIVIIILFVYLAVRLSWSIVRTVEHGRNVSSDLSHCIAFILGLFAVKLTHVR